MDFKQRASLDFQEGQLKHIISEMKQIIDDHKELVRSCDISLVSANISKTNIDSKAYIFLTNFYPTEDKQKAN